ncbi:MAG: AAA family ATPase [Spirochaetaceae bacterium]
MAVNDLFENTQETRSQPLAARMRPRTLDEFIGQEHIVGPGRLLRRAIAADQLGSLILSGPPGTGKTTLAQVIAGTTRSAFISLNAVLGGVKDVRDAVSKARDHRDLHGRKTILFVDEVHRWNKAQQDALLPWVENGTIVLIGATTENPFFEVNAALVSRSRIFRLTPLQPEHLRQIAEMALRDPNRGYGALKVAVDDDALDHLIRIADGDARTLLNALQLAVETGTDAANPENNGEIHVTLGVAEDSIQAKALLYDKEGDYHYDSISAFIKSLRGSDPDAALYWTARMLLAGEDPKYLFRRMLVFASEDVGLADSHALTLVESAASAFERVGMPEGQFHLSHAVLYLATAPKSNSTLGYYDAVKAVERERQADVPKHLRDGSRDMHGFGHGEGYLYPHAYREHWVAQNYLPQELAGRVFYVPGTEGDEPERSSLLQRRRFLQMASETGEDDSEILSYSPGSDRRSRWHYRSSESTDYYSGLIEVCFSRAPVLRHSRVFTFESATPALTWEALQRVPEGLLVACLSSDDHVAAMQHYSRHLEWRPVIAAGLPSTMLGGEAAREVLDVFDNNPPVFDLIILNRLFTLLRKQEQGESGLSRELAVVRSALAPDGVCVCLEPAPGSGQRLSHLLASSESDPSSDYLSLLREVESTLFTETEEHERRRLVDQCSASGLRVEKAETAQIQRSRTVTEPMISSWFDQNTGGYGVRLTESHGEAVRAAVSAWVTREIGEHRINWTSSVHVLTCRRD